MLTNLPVYLANGKKAIINITGLVASLLALGLLPGKYATYGAAVLAVLTAITHYLTANAPAPGQETAMEIDESDQTEPADTSDQVFEIPEAYVPEHSDDANQAVEADPVADPPTE